MNKKLSLIILFLLFISLISVLLAFMAFSKGGNSNDVGQLKTGYEQLSKQVNELKVTTEELGTKVNSGDTTASNPTTQPTQQPTQPATQTPAQPVTQTKTIAGDKVNMRSGATTNAQVVRQLPKGESVTPTGMTASSGGFQWVQIKDSKGNTGWVVSTFVK